MSDNEEGKSIEEFVQTRPHRVVSETDSFLKIFHAGFAELQSDVEVRFKKYLDKEKSEILESFFEEMRKTAFVFHMRLLRKAAYAMFKADPKLKEQAVKQYADAFQRMAKLYGYL